MHANITKQMLLHLCSTYRSVVPWIQVDGARFGYVVTQGRTVLAVPYLTTVIVVCSTLEEVCQTRSSSHVLRCPEAILPQRIYFATMHMDHVVLACTCSAMFA